MARKHVNVVSEFPDDYSSGILYLESFEDYVALDVKVANQSDVVTEWMKGWAQYIHQSQSNEPRGCAQSQVFGMVYGNKSTYDTESGSVRDLMEVWKQRLNEQLNHQLSQCFVDTANTQATRESIKEILYTPAKPIDHIGLTFTFNFDGFAKYGNAEVTVS